MLRDVGSERTFRLFAIVLFALLAGLNYFPALIGKIPFPRDLVLQFPAWKEVPRSEPLQRYADIGDLVTLVYPFRSFAASAVRSGTLPLWNPHFQSGAPFQADPQSALFYPPNFFYYVLPTPIAWAVCLFVRMVLAGFFTTLFVREIGGTKAGSIFSGIVFASCGFITAWQGQCIGDASIWLPLVGYAVHRLHRDRTNFSVALAGIAFAMPVLAGHPETALHVTLAGLLMAAFWWAASIRPRARYFNAGFLLSFALAGLLALGLASIQIIPTLEWLRGIEWALNFQWPVSALHDMLAWASRDILRYPSAAGIWVPNAQVYAGMITLLAASQAPFHKTKKHVILLAAMIVLGLCIAWHRARKLAGVTHADGWRCEERQDDPPRGLRRSRPRRPGHFRSPAGVVLGPAAFNGAVSPGRCVPSYFPVGLQPSGRDAIQGRVHPAAFVFQSAAVPWPCADSLAATRRSSRTLICGGRMRPCHIRPCDFQLRLYGFRTARRDIPASPCV